MLSSESSLATSEISFFKVVYVRSVYAPVVAASVSSLANFNEALVERQVVSNAVPPAFVSAVLIVRIVLDDPIVDLVE